MGKFDFSDESIDWGIKTAIVVRTFEVKNNSLVADFRGSVIAVIPYQSESGRQNALKVAKQICAANIDFAFETE